MNVAQRFATKRHSQSKTGLAPKPKEEQVNQKRNGKKTHKNANLILHSPEINTAVSILIRNYRLTD